MQGILSSALYTLGIGRGAGHVTPDAHGDGAAASQGAATRRSAAAGPSGNGISNGSVDEDARPHRIVIVWWPEKDIGDLCEGLSKWLPHGSHVSVVCAKEPLVRDLHVDASHMRCMITRGSFFALFCGLKSMQFGHVFFSSMKLQSLCRNCLMRVR